MPEKRIVYRPFEDQLECLHCGAVENSSPGGELEHFDIPDFDADTMTLKCQACQTTTTFTVEELLYL